MEIAQFFVQIKDVTTILHVMSVIFGMGAAIMSDALFTFYSEDKKLSSLEKKTLRFLSNLVWWGIVFIIISGFSIFLSDVSKYIHSAKFLAKMSIMIVLLLNGFVLHRYVWKHVIKRNFLVDVKEVVMRKVAFACGAISILSWISVLILGSLHSVSLEYSSILSLYGTLVVVGIITALFVEKRTFEK